MKPSPIRVGICGFGRIGRTVARIIADRPDMELVAINDITEDVANLAYLYNYDSTYGAPTRKASTDSSRRAIQIGDRLIDVFCERDVAAVDWRGAGVDVLVDASGVRENVAKASSLVAHGQVKKVIVTHSPNIGIDRYIILGVNDDSYDPAKDHVISSSICDANAIAHPLLALEQAFGIEDGFVTTLHPWLSYQNLVDAPLASQSNPGHFWKDYSLGRASVGAIIPKDTTAVSALAVVLPEIAQKIGAFSYRIPTPTVASADITLRLRQDVSHDEVVSVLKGMVERCPHLGLNAEALISVDYERCPSSAVLDLQWVKLMGDRLVKIVLWYDNEWGYSSRVADMVRFVVTKGKAQ